MHDCSRLVSPSRVPARRPQAARQMWWDRGGTRTGRKSANRHGVPLFLFQVICSNGVSVALARAAAAVTIIPASYWQVPTKQKLQQSLLFMQASPEGLQ